MHSDTDYQLNQLCLKNQELRTRMDDYHNEMKYLLSSVTHEIRNPLTLMYSTIQLMEKKHPELLQISYWPTLTEDMKNIFSLLDDLSTFNHCDSLHKEPIDLLSLLTELKLSFEPLAKEKNIPISITITDRVHPYSTSYLGDLIKLKQVFTNLIKNGIEASFKDQSIKIKVSLTSPPIDSSLVEEQKNFLCISITNLGTTIPEEELEHIFKPFFTTKPTGSGLGLPTAKRIIHSHNGFLTVTSKDEITTFSVFLPL